MCCVLPVYNHAAEHTDYCAYYETLYWCHSVSAMEELHDLPEQEKLPFDVSAGCV